MKESVVDIHDLQEAAPFFKSRFGSFLGKVLIKWLSIDKVNKAHNSLAERPVDRY